MGWGSGEIGSRLWSQRTVTATTSLVNLTKNPQFSPTSQNSRPAVAHMRQPSYNKSFARLQKLAEVHQFYVSTREDKKCPADLIHSFKKGLLVLTKLSQPRDGPETLTTTYMD
ncbi:MAG: hypothetical protein Q9200_004614 [Gallowayella weberi]